MEHQVGKYGTRRIFSISPEDQNEGFIQMALSKDQMKKRVFLERYSKDEENYAKARLNLFQRIDHQHIAKLASYDEESGDIVIAFERTDESLSNIIRQKEKFWKTNACGEITGMKPGLQKFILCILQALLYLNEKGLAIEYDDDFTRLYLVDGDLGQPKLYIKKFAVFTERVNDRKLKMEMLKSILQRIRIHQKIDTKHKGFEDFENTLDVLYTCETPMEVLKYHPEIVSTDNKSRNLGKVYDKWVLNLGGMRKCMGTWFGNVRKVEGEYDSWINKIDDKGMVAAYKEYRKRYEECPGADCIGGLVFFIRDRMDHIDSDSEVYYRDGGVLGYFEKKWPELLFELHHYIYQINPARVQ